MQNVEFASSLCSSKLLKALGCWLLDLAPGCEAPFALSHWLLLLLVCNSFFSQSKFLLFLVSSSLCSWATLLLLLTKAPFAPSLQLFLLLVYSSSWSQLELLLLLVGSSSCSQLAIPLTFGWQLFLLLVSGFSWSLSNSSCSWSVVFRNHSQNSFWSQFATLIVAGLQFLLVLVRTLFGPGWQLLLLLIGSPSCSKLVNRLAIGL